jgi:hypothetical protein
MRTLSPPAAKAGLIAVIVLGSALAAAAVVFATGPATARGAVVEHMTAGGSPLCPDGDRPAR